MCVCRGLTLFLFLWRARGRSRPWMGSGCMPVEETRVSKTRRGWSRRSKEPWPTAAPPFLSSGRDRALENLMNHPFSRLRLQWVNVWARIVIPQERPACAWRSPWKIAGPPGLLIEAFAADPRARRWNLQNCRETYTRRIYGAGKQTSLAQRQNSITRHLRSCADSRVSVNFHAARGFIE